MEWEFFYDDGHEYLQNGLPYYEEVLSSPPTTPRKIKGTSTEEGSLQDVTSPSSPEDFHDLVSLEMQIMKKVATRLQDFESQITAQLSHVTTDFDKKLSDVHRSSATSRAIDGVGPYTGLDTMAEDVDQLKFDVGELKDLLTNNKGEVNHIRGSVLACAPDMEDFMATMTAEISRMRLDIGDIQEALKNHDSGMEDVSNTLQQMQEKEDNITEDLINLKKEFITKLDGKVDNVAWKEANDNLDAAVKTVHDMISSLRLDVDARHRKVDEILSTMRHDITSVETNLEESKAKLAMDTDHAINALNGRIDFTNKREVSATQESLHTTRNSLSDCFNEVAVVRSADTEAWVKNDARRQKQQEIMEKIGDVEQQSELCAAEASRRLVALDLRMSGVQGGLGEQKRDILKLREEEQPQSSKQEFDSQRKHLQAQFQASKEASEEQKELQPKSTRFSALAAQRENLEEFVEKRTGWIELDRTDGKLEASQRVDKMVAQYVEMKAAKAAKEKALSKDVQKKRKELQEQPQSSKQEFVEERTGSIEPDRTDGRSEASQRVDRMVAQYVEMKVRFGVEKPVLLKPMARLRR